MQPNNELSSRGEESIETAKVGKQIAVFAMRGTQSSGKFISNQRLYLLMCDVNADGGPLVPKNATTAPKCYFVEENYGAKRRFRSTTLVFERLVEEINRGKISYDNAVKVASFLAGNQTRRSTLHEYATEKNLFKAVKACLKNPDLSLDEALEENSIRRRKVLEESSLSL
jgi:hypothetical protein